MNGSYASERLPADPTNQKAPVSTLQRHGVLPIIFLQFQSMGTLPALLEAPSHCQEVHCSLCHLLNDLMCMEDICLHVLPATLYKNCKVFSIQYSVGLYKQKWVHRIQNQGRGKISLGHSETKHQSSMWTANIYIR